MSYVKQNFVKGQILKADHLNHMEDGIAAAAVGVQGPKGDKGDPGPQGPKGDKGDTGPAVALDPTLTISGKAADAKATGDAVGQLKEDLGDMFAELTVSEYAGGLMAEDLTWGYVNGSNGSISNQKNRLITVDYLDANVTRVECATPYYIRISAWDRESDAYIGNWNGSGWANTNANHSAFDAFVPEYKYKICIVCPANAEDDAAFAAAAKSVTLFFNAFSGTADDVVDALRRKTVSGTSLAISDAIAGVPMRCTCDSPVTVSGLNILPLRNVSFTGVEKLVKLGVTIPAGTYTMSMSCESTDTDSEQSLIQFGGLYIRIPHDGVRYRRKITTKTESDSINFYSGYDAAGSAGDTVFWRDLMLVRGDVNAEFEEYIEPHTWESAQDVVLSAQTNLIEADSNIELTYIQRNEFVDSLLSATKSAELNAQTLGYVTPEMFGAVGDGVTDDAQSVQACIGLAKERAIPVKMMKSYLISEGITIDSNMIVEINYLIYTGTQAAVTLVGNSSSVTINRIKSNGTGVAFISDNIMVNYNRVILGDVVCAGNCIHLHGTNKNIHQNHIEFQRLYAGGDGYNCILLASDSAAAGVAEITFIGGRCSHADWAYNGGGGNNKLMFFQVEGDIKGGYYFNGNVKALVIGDRHDESQRDGEYPYIKIVVPETNGPDAQVFGQFRFITPLGLNVNEIDVSEVLAQTPSIAHMRSNGSWGVIDCRITSYQRTGSDDPKRSQMFGERALIWANCLIFQGAPEKYWQVTENMDLRTITEDTPAMPTVFDIACENAEIWLHPTYCFMGISRFEVIQTVDHTATIYDYFTGTAIFDGASLGEGTFEVRTLLNGNNATLDGTNMIWMVRKIG